jgi:hypothetical protein
MDGGTVNEPQIVYGDVSTLMPFDDGVGAEAHYVFSMVNFAELVANYGPDKVMNDLFQANPAVYAALCAHFYNGYKTDAVKNPHVYS